MNSIVQNSLLGLLAIGVFVFLAVLHEAWWQAKRMPGIQTLVLNILSELGRVRGRELRIKLAEKGHRIRLVRFYMMMTCLVDKGLVIELKDPEQDHGLLSYCLPRQEPKL